MLNESFAQICLAVKPGRNPIALAARTVRLFNLCLCRCINSRLLIIAACEDEVVVFCRLEIIANFRCCSEGNRLEIASRKLLIVKTEQISKQAGTVKDSSCDGTLSSFMNLNRINAQISIIKDRDWMVLWARS